MVKRIKKLRKMAPHLSDSEILNILEKDNPNLKEIEAAEKMFHAVI